MELKTNQMQTDLQKYRDGWDFIFNKNNMNTMFVHQELKKVSAIGKAASFSAEKLVIQLAKSNEKIGCLTRWDINKVNKTIKIYSKESDNADRS